MSFPNQPPPAAWPPVPDETEPAAAAVPRRRRRWPIVAAAISVVIVLAAAGLTAYLLTRRPATATDNPTSTAKLVTACQESAKRQLQAPATAQFSEEWTSQVGPTTWKVIGAVDAQNGFGALIRQRYVCMAEQGPDRWVVSDVQFTDWN